MDNKENEISVHALVISTAIVSVCAGWLLHTVVNSTFELVSAATAPTPNE